MTKSNLAEQDHIARQAEYLVSVCSSVGLLIQIFSNSYITYTKSRANSVRTKDFEVDPATIEVVSMLSSRLCCLCPRGTHPRLRSTWCFCSCHCCVLVPALVFRVLVFWLKYSDILRERESTIPRTRRDLLICLLPRFSSFNSESSIHIRSSCCSRLTLSASSSNSSSYSARRHEACWTWNACSVLELKLVLHHPHVIVCVVGDGVWDGVWDGVEVVEVVEAVEVVEDFEDEQVGQTHVSSSSSSSSATTFFLGGGDAKQFRWYINVPVFECLSVDLSMSNSCS